MSVCISGKLISYDSDISDVSSYDSSRLGGIPDPRGFQAVINSGLVKNHQIFYEGMKNPHILPGIKDILSVNGFDCSWDIFGFHKDQAIYFDLGDELYSSNSISDYNLAFLNHDKVLAKLSMEVGERGLILSDISAIESKFSKNLKDKPWKNVLVQTSKKWSDRYSMELIMPETWVSDYVFPEDMKKASNLEKALASFTSGTNIQDMFKNISLEKYLSAFIKESDSRIHEGLSNFSLSSEYIFKNAGYSQLYNPSIGYEDIYLDAPFAIYLNYDNMPAAYVSFHLDKNMMHIFQVQCYPRDDIRWTFSPHKAAMGLALYFAAANKIGNATVVPAEFNTWDTINGKKTRRKWPFFWKKMPDDNAISRSKMIYNGNARQFGMKKSNEFFPEDMMDYCYSIHPAKARIIKDIL